MTQTSPSSPPTLATLGPGSSCRVLDVADDSPIRARLLDLGFTPDTEVHVVRRAPLGDPVVYELRGMRLCLRGSEAAWIRVRPA